MGKSIMPFIASVFFLIVGCPIGRLTISRCIMNMILETGA